jgi:hypothetical protein
MEWIWDWEPGVVEEELDCWDWDTELLLEFGPLLTSTIDLRSGSAVAGLVLTLSTAIFLLIVLIGTSESGVKLVKPSLNPLKIR